MHLISMADGRSFDINLGLFSDTESDVEEFEGFDARDTRPYAEIASKAFLFHSKPLPKAKRVCIDSDDDRSMSSDEHFTSERCSSSSSVEGEVAPDIFKCDSSGKYGAVLSQASMNEEASSSSLEGEISNDRDEWKQRLPAISLDNSASFGQEFTSATLEQAKENESPKLRTRRRGKHRSTIKTPKELSNENCCSEKKCLKTILSLKQITKAREMFCQENQTYETQRQHILDWFDRNQPKEGEFVYYVSGLKVCWSAWTKVLGITQRRFFSLKRDYLTGRRNARHGGSLASRDSIQSEAVINFLNKYFAESCDYMPNSSVWHLTSTSRKVDVFEEFKETMEATGQPVSSESLFRNIWKEKFSHVKIPKENRFSKCDTCCNLKVEIRGTTNPIKKQAIEGRRKGHVAWVREERKSYMSRASQAHHQPNKYFSVAIDGMDTTKTELPFSAHRHGTSQKAWHLKVHIVGVLIHGRHPICFLDYHQFPHDSNLLINIFLQTVWVHRGLLAGSIFLQLDNTARENKNQYVFCFLGYLVETKVFERIEISFLPVGHTHVDVDQMFSRISVATEKNGCLTPQDLLRIVRRSYKQGQGDTTQEGAHPQYANTQSLYAVREWLLPHMQQLHGLSGFHSFVIVRNTAGKAVLHFKPWCTSQWEEYAYEPVELLRTMPTGLPDLIMPNYKAVDLPKLRSMVEKCTNNGIFKSVEKEEWMTFLENEQHQADLYKDVEERNVDGSKYHKKELVYLPCRDSRWLVDDLRERDLPSEDTPQLSNVLKRSEAFERGDGLLPVYTGSYRRPGQVQRQVIRNESRENIEKGMLVAVLLDKYPEEKPLIGRVDEVSGDKLELTWMNGHWTTSWSICKKRQGQRMVEWTEEVDKSAVVLFDFKLTLTGKLRQATVRELKRVYGLEQSSDSD